MIHMLVMEVEMEGYDCEKCQEGKRDKPLSRGVGDGSNDCTRTSIKKT